MSKERKWPVALKVDIEPEGLKRVVKEGRLMEFVNAFSTLASEHIKVQLVEQLAKAGVGLAKLGESVSIAIGFDVDDPYGTPPKPWPWPKAMLGAVLEHEVRNIVRKELAQMK
jgi:hypothetical protein